MAILSPLKAVFSPSLFILCCHPTQAFSFPSFHPDPEDRSLPSTLFWIHWFLYRLPYSCGTSAFRSTLQFFPKALPYFQHCWSACAMRAAATGTSSPSVAWFGAIAGSKKILTSTAIQILLLPFFLFQTAVKWHKQVKLHQYCQKNRSTTLDALFLVQWSWFRKMENNTLSERRFFWGKKNKSISGNVFNRALKMRSPEERPIQVCRFWHSFWVTPTVFLPSWMNLHNASLGISKCVRMCLNKASMSMQERPSHTLEKWKKKTTEKNMYIFFKFFQLSFFYRHLLFLSVGNAAKIQG